MKKLGHITDLNLSSHSRLGCHLLWKSYARSFANRNQQVQLDTKQTDFPPKGKTKKKNGGNGWVHYPPTILCV